MTKWKFQAHEFHCLDSFSQWQYLVFQKNRLLWLIPVFSRAKFPFEAFFEHEHRVRIYEWISVCLLNQSIVCPVHVSDQKNEEESNETIT